MTHRSTTLPKIAKLWISGPFRQSFDYLIPSALQPVIQTNIRVMVPFGRRQVVGLVEALLLESSYDIKKLKSIETLIDQEPILSSEIDQLCRWVADYYHFPLGETFFSVFPKWLREGRSCEKIITTNIAKIPTVIHSDNQPKLNIEQKEAVVAIQQTEKFQCFVLAGITGSGKTEVYLQVIANVLQKNQSALMLVPEIALTPQTIARFQARFSTNIVVLHSRLTAKERAQAWLKARFGAAKIIIGTRSAVFVPIPNLGVIIIDEEHDASFKQQSGLRYHARAVALVRAKNQNIPIVLGSATPSLEVLYNIQQRQYILLKLMQRATSATLPTIHCIDLKNQKPQSGITLLLEQAIEKHLKAKQQVMIFINRRGFCPVLFCHQCGYSATCPHCAVKLVLHEKQKILCCHHCGFKQSMMKFCPQCQHDQLIHVGYGTEKVAEYLLRRFPDYEVLRIDSDSTQKKASFDQMLERIHEQKAHILVGTQMLAKGHHFPHLSLVAMLDADYGFYSNDFRALESLGQLMMQVSGRAGREQIPGEVYIQTHEPEHPLLKILFNDGYLAFAETLLKMRQQAALPPVSHVALLCAEHANESKGKQLLVMIMALPLKDTLMQTHLERLGPVSAPIAKKSGRYRWQLLLRSNQRKVLHDYLKILIQWLDQSSLAKAVKWSLDVDPLDFY